MLIYIHIYNMYYIMLIYIYIYINIKCYNADQPGEKRPTKSAAKDRSKDVKEKGKVKVYIT